MQTEMSATDRCRSITVLEVNSLNGGRTSTQFPSVDFNFYKQKRRNKSAASPESLADLSDISDTLLPT